MNCYPLSEVISEPYVFYVQLFLCPIFQFFPFFLILIKLRLFFFSLISLLSYTGLV